MKRIASIVAAVGCVVGVAASAQAQEFRLLNSWDPNFPATKVITVPFMEALKAGSQGGINVTMFGPESVPAFEQMQPVQSGAFQFLMTHGSYHYGTFGIGQASDTLKRDAKALRESGVWAAFDDAYQKRGLKLVAMPMHREGYQFVMRRGLPESGDLKGMKMRSTPGYVALIGSLGGAPVTLPPSDVYGALDKGVVDGAGWSTIGILSFRWNEVANTLVRPTFGNSIYLLLMNLDAFKRLDAAKQKIVLDVGRKIEDDAQATFSKLTADEERELLAKGMRVVQFPPKVAADLPRLFSEGLWTLVEKKEGDAGKALRAFARSKGMTD